MSRGLYVALSGAVAQEQALESTAQNLANSATAGYQRMRPVFNEALRGASKRNEQLHYTVTSRQALDTSRGALRQTGRGLDVALPENQYLAITTPRGDRFTRSGALQMGADGLLKTSSGMQLVREDGKPIQLSPAAGEPSIHPDGSILQDGNVVGRLKIVKAAEGTSFQHEAGGVLTASGPAPTVTDTTLEVGVLEDSNATAVTAMTDMVTASRTFEAFQKMLDTFGECDRKVLTTVPGAVET